MMQSSATKTTFLAMSALLVGAGVAGCNGKGGAPATTPGSDVGAASFALSVSGLDIAKVHYIIKDITRPAPVVPDREADVLVPGTGPSASFLVSGLVPDKYSIALSADGVPAGGGSTVACTGSATFDVIPGMTVRKSIVLNCGETKTTGSVAVNATIAFNSCPSIASYLLSSTQVAPGGVIDLSATGSDRDPSLTLAFSWSTTNGGSFLDSAAATTKFTCPPAPAKGPHILTVTVANGLSTDPLACNSSGAQESIQVLCVDPKCGNGSVDPGEACDHGSSNGSATDSCTFTCTSNTCGNGMIDAGEGCDDGAANNGPGKRCSIACVLTPVCGDTKKDGTEQCDDGNLVSFDGCSSTCKTETPVCGNNQKEAGEACDDGNLVNFDGCSATCTIETATCGNGAKEAGEGCDDGNLVNFDGCSASCQIETPVCGNNQKETGEACDDGNLTNLDGCSSTCKVESACFQCEETNRGGTCQQDMGCENLTGADKTLCLGMLNCMIANPTCWATNPNKCLCGTATGTTCATAPNGVCKDQAAAAAKTVTAGVTDWTATGLRFFSLTYPVGHATTQITCDIAACGGNAGVCSAATR